MPRTPEQVKLGRTATLMALIHEQIQEPEACPACQNYLTRFRRVLLPIVGRQVQITGRPPADIVARITAGAHRRNHLEGNHA